MKSFKKYTIIIIFIFIIIGCSVYLNNDLIIRNNSSYDIKIRIARHENLFIDNEYIEEIFLKKYQEKLLESFISRNHYYTPNEYLIFIIIYNENNELIKEFNKKINMELFKSLVFNFERDRMHNKLYSFTITDELLELE